MSMRLMKNWTFIKEGKAMLLCGIDDAGRGPVIGPMVLAGVAVAEKDEQKLAAIGARDSKTLTPLQRERLFGEIIRTSSGYHIVQAAPSEIDEAVNGRDGLNLNWLEARMTADIIRALKPQQAILDCPSNNLGAYKAYVLRLLSDVAVDIVVAHRADAKYPSVSAASILAKVTRDSEIAKIQARVKEPLGSGYPADPVTVAFLKRHYEAYPEIFRKSWASYRRVAEKGSQKGLFEF